MNHPTYLQWNCRGFKVNCNELSLLIQNYCPEALCLQETNFKETDKINIKNYIMYNCYAQTDRTSGGSSIAINNRYFHSQINLKTNLQAVAIRFITLCSVYIPQNYLLQPREFI